MESDKKVLEGKEKVITVDTEALKRIKLYGEALKSDREALKGNGEALEQIRSMKERQEGF